MAENSPLPEVPECSIERHGDGFKVVHESGTSALAPDERKARLAGLRLRILADLTSAEALRLTGEPT
jgi:hypothetical protein